MFENIIYDFGKQLRWHVIFTSEIRITTSSIFVNNKKTSLRSIFGNHQDNTSKRLMREAFSFSAGKHR